MNAECAHCGVKFSPHKAGHIYCSIACRHRGPREPHQRHPIDHAATARLFDESRDPEGRVREDDWHPDPDSGFFELELCDTVKRRRQWYVNLVKLGRI